MKPYIFSHRLCTFAWCVEDGEWFDGTVTKENETLEVKSGREFLSKKENVDWLRQEEIINDFLFGVRQQVEAVMEQEQSGNAEGKFQGGKQVYLFNGIADKILQCNDAETRTIEEDFPRKSGSSDETKEKF